MLHNIPIDTINIIIQYVDLNGLYSLLLTHSKIRNIIGFSDVWNNHHSKSRLINYIKTKQIYQSIINTPECEFTGKIQPYYGKHYYLFRIKKWFKNFKLNIGKLHDHNFTNDIETILNLLQKMKYAEIYQNYMKYMSFNYQFSKSTLEAYHKIKYYLYIEFYQSIIRHFHLILLQFPYQGKIESYSFEFNIICDISDDPVNFAIYDNIFGKVYYYTLNNGGNKQFLENICQKLNVNLTDLMYVLINQSSSDISNNYNLRYAFMNLVS
jgi:hypothetical protein